MPALSTDKVIERLTRKIQDEFDPDELLEVHNELFEDDPYTPEEAHDNPFQITEQLIDHLNGDLDPEEMLQMWNLVSPGDRHVWYDEEKAFTTTMKKRRKTPNR